MTTEPELMNAVKVYRDNLKLEAKIERINNKIEKNHQLIIKHFFPYLLSTYKKWRPKLKEKAMCIDLEDQHCFEVTIKNIDGYMVRAQQGQKSVYHNFTLNPILEEYEVANFIIPKWSYDEIKHLFRLTIF
ncbi:hypothetical protein THIOM_004890 [Candidatus Thiomargarita nelsonii]|uniref:Uncharacterized protein n=1 Tax=Candidatus Thiomargarita nelsonii TaxID=1003181 RepID=A0A176RUP7_9GAMM|nr:hypothetical protein THIOM_004890 [Candidatus Thiomargarita nelsonii]